jgi:hypothetical protein
MIEFERDTNPIISANRIINTFNSIEFPINVEVKNGTKNNER